MIKMGSMQAQPDKRGLVTPWSREREPRGKVHEIQNLKRSYYNKGTSKLNVNESLSLELEAPLDDIELKLFSLQRKTEAPKR